MKPDRSTIFALLALVGAAGCTRILVAAWTPPSIAPAAQIQGGYILEPAHTQIMFSVLHMGFTNYYGRFSGASGSLRFTPDDVAHMAVDVSVPAASISTTSALLNTTLQGPDWLDAATYSTMRFTSTSVTQTAAATADVRGNLLLHGVTRPVTLHAVFNGEGVNPLNQRHTLGFQISGEIRRSDFGVLTDVPLVSDEVQLIIAAAFEK